MFFIPAEEYMMLLFSWLFLFIFIKIEAAITRNKTHDPEDEISTTKQAFYLACVVLVYALFILFSHFWRYAEGSFIVLMIVFTAIFTFGCCITIMLYKQIIPRNKAGATGNYVTSFSSQSSSRGKVNVVFTQ
uniref:XK-related protein n=1 Tax=Ciona savignyi TaxID=51511 RepID=H2YWE2_CIOSA